MKKKVIKTCAYCRNEITDAHYRVFCPECGADYHKDCWLRNNGCVTSGCTYNRNKDIPENICPACGTEMKDHYIYCKKCGRARNGKAQEIVYPKESTYYVPQTAAEIADKLIGKGSTYYMNSFEKINKGEKKLSFNVFAFLFTAFWFLYRKMFTQGIMLILFIALIGASMAVFGLTPLNVILALVLMLGCGFFANGIYSGHIDLLTEKVKDIPLDTRMTYINKKGGAVFSK